ncbi:exopolysaccharide production protein ExoZ [Pseudomonas sp. IT-P171]|uniref:acyltransferase family protein n=1 Tax=Pseudomonas sp. IT-P171 TaxID=3026453 RepID=UPI0039DFA06A
MQVVKQNEDISALRGIAILLVVSYHVGSVSFIPDWLKTILVNFNGGCGVDLFFVISGFLVSESLSRSFANRKISARRSLSVFFARRWFRTVIPGVVWVIAWTALSFMIPLLGNPYDNLHHAIAAILQVAHLYLYFHCVKVGECGIFGYYWTLSLEEWFYALLPLLVIVAKIRVAVAAIVFFIVLLFIVGFNEWPLWGVFRIQPMLIGVLIFFYKDSVTSFAYKTLAGRSGLALSVAVVAALTYVNSHYSVKGYIFVVVMCAALFLMALPGQGMLVGNGLIRDRLSAAGKVSFSTYLVHMPLILIADHFYSRNIEWVSPIIPAVFLAISLWFLSVRSFIHLEEPCRDLGYRVSDKISTSGMAVGAQEKA